MKHSSPRLRAVGLGVAVLALAAAVTGAGCAKKSLTVHGTVRYKDRPLPSGVVRCYLPGDRLVAVPLQPDGTFIMTDLTPGEVKVAIVEDPAAGMQAILPPGRSHAEAVKRVPIPAKYQDPATSGLAYTITSDNQDVEIKMQ